LIGYNPNVARARGKAKEAAGWLTGDRKLEAEGRAEEKDSEPTADEVADEVREVRRQYGETPDSSGDPDTRH
jgi:uncharacterized protein YjbJ (UPF0337 family)